MTVKNAAEPPNVIDTGRILSPMSVALRSGSVRTLSATDNWSGEGEHHVDQRSVDGTEIST